MADSSASRIARRQRASTAKTPSTLHLSPLSVLQAFRGMCASAQRGELQGGSFPFVYLQPPVPRNLVGVTVKMLPLTRGERLRVVGCGMMFKIVRLLSLGVVRSSTATTQQR